MAYKITVSDGPVTVTVETAVAGDAAAVLAVSVLQKVQRSKSFDLPLPWRGPDRHIPGSIPKDWGRIGGGSIPSPETAPRVFL